MGAEVCQNITQGVLTRSDIGINTLHAGFREASAEHGLHLLGTISFETDISGVAIRAARGHDLPVPAYVTDQTILRGVVGHRQGTVLAVGCVTAFRTLERSCESSAVQQQNDLFSLVQAIIDGHTQALRKNAQVSFILGLTAHIQYSGQREPLAIGSFIHAQHAVFTLLHVVQGFEGGGGGTQHNGGIFHSGA